jgi:hypothetical protein
MRKWWRNWKDKILNDETYFRRQVRSTAGAFSVGGFGFAQKLAELFSTHPHPKIILWIQVTSLVCFFLILRMKMSESPEEKADQVHAVLADRGVLPASNGSVEIPLAPINRAQP